MNRTKYIQINVELPHNCFKFTSHSLLRMKSFYDPKRRDNK